jgi:hypothetical protein
MEGAPAAVCLCPFNEMFDGTPKYARQSLCIIEWSYEPGCEGDTIQKLMAGRVVQGRPDVSLSSVGGRPSLLCGWTDGVADIQSHFLRMPSGQAIEVQLAIVTDFRGEDQANEVVRVLGSLEWT